MDSKGLIILILVFVVVLALAVFIAWKAAIAYRIKFVEAKVGSAEEKARDSDHRRTNLH